MGEDEGGAAPGWDAISAAMSALYPRQEPHHYGTVLPYAFGGPDPIHGISVYDASPPDHWHFVTYGFSELWEKESDDPEVSGYGFELTLRLAKRESEPPAYAMNFLQNLGRYVFSRGRTFSSGDHMDLNGPMRAESSSAITAICFARDPELPDLATPNGRVEFPQIVGLTADELLAVKAWNTQSFVDVLAEHAPRLVTDIERASFLARADFAKMVAEGTAKEGSSTSILFMDKLAVEAEGADRHLLTIGANPAGTAMHVLPARIRHGRELELRSAGASVVFQPAARASVAVDAQSLRVDVSEAALAELIGALRPERGRRALRTLPLTIEVVPTEITDNAGKVVRVIG